MVATRIERDTFGEIEVITYTGVQNARLTGTGGANTITGSIGADSLVGWWKLVDATSGPMATRLVTAAIAAKPCGVTRSSWSFPPMSCTSFPCQPSSRRILVTSSASKHWCAGVTPSAACFHRANSYRWPSKAA